MTFYHLSNLVTSLGYVQHPNSEFNISSTDSYTIRFIYPLYYMTHFVITHKSYKKKYPYNERGFFSRLHFFLLL